VPLEVVEEESGVLEGSGVPEESGVLEVPEVLEVPGSAEGSSAVVNAARETLSTAIHSKRRCARIANKCVCA